MAIIIIDPGHGFVETSEDEDNSPSYTYQNQETVYEGNYNRVIAKKVQSIFKTIEGIKVVYSVDINSNEDTPLDDRIKVVNRYNKKTTVLLSLHSGTSSLHDERGLELWTSIGRVRSEKLSRNISIEMMDNLKRFDSTFRFDYIHNVYNRDSRFKIMRKTKCPSISFGNLFYDNPKDLMLLKNNDFLDELAISIVEGTMEFVNSSIKKIDEV